MYRWFAAVVAAFLACGCAHGDGHSAAAGSDGRATVVRVIDGDTIVAKVGDSRRTRAPHRHRHPRDPQTRHPVECFGPEASARLAELIPPGTSRAARARPRVARRLRPAARLRVPRATGCSSTWRWCTDGFAGPLAIAPNTAHRVEIDGAAARRPGRSIGLVGRVRRIPRRREADSVLRRDDARGTAGPRPRRSAADHQLRRPRFELRRQRRLLRGAPRRPRHELDARWCRARGPARRRPATWARTSAYT